MRIAPINYINSFRGINFNQNKTVSNIFAKSNGVDTVSFSGRKNVKPEARYILETRTAKLITSRDTRLDDKTDSVHTKLNTRINEFIEQANKVNKEAEKLRKTAKSAYKRGDKELLADTTSNLPQGHTAFILLLKNSDALHVTYDTNKDEVEAISKYSHKKDSITYSYDPSTGKLNRYCTGTEDIKYSDEKIEGTINSSDKETTFHIDYWSGNISHARVEECVYNNEADPNHKKPVIIERLAKSAVCPEHSGHVGYALTENCESDTKKTSFMQWISYE